MKLTEAIAKALDTCARMAALHGARRAARARHLALAALAAEAYRVAEEELTKKERALHAAIDDYFATKDLAEDLAIKLDALRRAADDGAQHGELARRVVERTVYVHASEGSAGIPITFTKGDADDDDDLAF